MRAVTDVVSCFDCSLPSSLHLAKQNGGMGLFEHIVRFYELAYMVVGQQTVINCD